MLLSNTIKKRKCMYETSETDINYSLVEFLTAHNLYRPDKDRGEAQCC